MIDEKKLIERLEEKQNDIIGNLSLNNYYSDGYDKGIEYAIEIVNQLAEEYKSRMIINGQYCFQTCACAEKCNQCSRLNGNDTDIDWYEDIEDWTEEYNNDVCEWKDGGKIIMCPHHTELAIVCLKEKENRYNFCPYCGKKIKVVNWLKAEREG